jgi:hypothetical protein
MEEVRWFWKERGDCDKKGHSDPSASFRKPSPVSSGQALAPTHFVSLRRLELAGAIGFDKLNPSARNGA